jgi:hypothetical protein
MIAHRSLFIVCILIALLPLRARGGCREEIAEVDVKLASEALDENARNAVGQFRDQAASLCERGHEATALQALGIIRTMLSQVEPDRSAGSKASSHAMQPEPAIRAEPEPVQSDARRTFPNRWDKLSQVDYCQWLTADELAGELTFHVPLECRKTPSGFRYELVDPGGDRPVAFMLIVEVHPGQESVRSAESGLSEGFAKRFFTPFDAGTPDLNVYVSTKGYYLYAFPAGGLTLWRLEYLEESPERDKYYSPSPGRSGNADLGPRFIEMLVDKYGNRL